MDLKGKMLSFFIGMAFTTGLIIQLFEAFMNFKLHLGFSVVSLLGLLLVFGFYIKSEMISMLFLVFNIIRWIGFRYQKMDFHQSVPVYELILGSIYFLGVLCVFISHRKKAASTVPSSEGDPPQSFGGQAERRIR